jgi:hypothetical protein
MEGVENAFIHGVTETVGLHVRGIPNKNTGARLAVDLWIVCLDEGEGAAPDLAEVGQGRDVASLYLVRSFPIQGGERSKV